KHSTKVQGEISRNEDKADFFHLHLKNANNADMIVCVLPPKILRNPSFLLQRDILQRGTEVSIQGNFDIFTGMSQYQIKIDSPNDIQLVPSASAEDEQTVVDVVQAYLDALETDGLLTEKEYEIQFGSGNGFADVVLVDQNGSLVVIAECKAIGHVGHGVEQLKSYLCATDTRFGIFANMTDPKQWKFYENRQRNRFDPITRDQFEDGVVKSVIFRKRFKDEIKSLESSRNQLKSEIGDLKTKKTEVTTDVRQESLKLDALKQAIESDRAHNQDLKSIQKHLSDEIGQLRADKAGLETEIGELEEKERGLHASRKQWKEKIQQFEIFLLDMKGDLLDSEPSPQSEDNVDPQKTRGEKKQSFMRRLKNLLSKENE
ncbi:MAG: type I restriction enzyme HsdR N-terminal domain-containing protein, partial [Candidatus Poribacteria bacterium]|nr:type I restriction enzyme HsdR N-terminal domain-containing protein [Candidatus Poribacteria bacterium]